MEKQHRRVYPGRSSSKIVGEIKKFSDKKAKTKKVHQY